MIILSSQVLSETIFLFLFSVFLYFSITIIVKKNQLYLRLLMAGLFWVYQQVLGLLPTL